MQSNLSYKLNEPRLHVGIIMDGNGRWATRQGLPRLAGHEAGVEAIRRVMEAAPDQGVGTLTLYAFSSDNWRRPEAEVTGLMALLRRYLRNEVKSLVRNDVRLTVIGRRDRLPDGLAGDIGDAETATARGNALHMRIAIDYSARDAILNAAAQFAGAGDATRAVFAQLVTGEAGLRDVTSISSSAPAARNGCRIFCSGRAPTPSCISPR
jgi:undecaprenyl diphosphate synthase